MDSVKKSIHTIEMGRISEDMTKIDFPVFTNKEKKKEIIYEKKLDVEEKLKESVPEYFPSEDILKQIWTESVGYTNGQFKHLSEKYRLNGFYLQELLHCYAMKISDVIFREMSVHGKIS